ncbi:MAG: hypothetical protein M3228_12845 [Actinomycetota bacterium]|nr:hypothetical protein [Actinomycetota bacterium]
MGVAVLACPIGMGVMMRMMMSGQGHGSRDVCARLTQLRAEIEKRKAK